jgi:hypothetical protein
MTRLDHTGKKYGRLTGIRFVRNSKNGRGIWLWQCDCGNRLWTKAENVTCGDTKSCGCWKKEVARENYRQMGLKYGRENGRRNNIKHGHNRNSKPSPIYKSWQAMLARCRNPNHVAYSRYGGRGITVCERWLTFENFYADMGERPVGKTLDRIDNDGNYEPGNCQWSTAKEQNNNQRTRKTKIQRNLVGELTNVV